MTARPSPRVSRRKPVAISRSSVMAMQLSRSLSLAVLCKADGQPEPVEELRFAPARRWRFDYAWPDYRLALEVQGGLFVRGRHTQGSALVAEQEKLNAAAAHGWRVIYCQPKDRASGAVLTVIRAALTDRRVPCVWTEDADTESWDGTCGVKWCLTDGSPFENGMHYCPRCGAPLKQEQDLSR